MEPATIAAVIEKYGSYSASLEREFVKSQQRPPDPPSLTPRRLASMKDTSKAVGNFLMQSGGWHSVRQIVEATGCGLTPVRSSLMHFARLRFIERHHHPSERDRMRSIQRYRWIG